MSNSQKRLLEQGLCIDCGINRAGASKYRCQQCLDWAKQRAKLKYGGVKKNG